jgi:peptide/nickel transport system permease protein
MAAHGDLLTTPLPPEAEVEVEVERGRPRWRRMTLELARSPSGVILLALILVAILAPLLAPHDPLQPFPAQKLQPPSADHPFGTDPRGLDVFSRVLYATRIDLSVAIGSVLLGVAAGLPLGALAGYLGGWIDNTLMRLTEMVQAFPPILFAMIVFGAAGNNVTTMILLIAFLNVPVYVKMVRSVTLPLRDAEFVQAARMAGHSSVSLTLKHLMPNTLVPVFSQFAISCGFAIQIVAALSFIGLGVQVPDAEWGSMINVGANQIVFGKWWPSVFPGLAAFLAAFALTNLGHRMRRSVLRET